MSERGPSTRVIRAALPDAGQGEPFLPGPVFAAPFHLTGDPYTAPQSYTRYGNPTWDRYEEAVGGLEGAQAVLFSSGMAAAAALLLTNLKPGSVLAMDHGCYHGVRALTEQHLEPRGVEVRLPPPPPPAAPRGGAPPPPAPRGRGGGGGGSRRPPGWRTRRGARTSCGSSRRRTRSSRCTTWRRSPRSA